MLVTKLTFPLFAACVDENIEKPLLDKVAECHHADAQRAFTGSWCTSELTKTLEKGYVIVHVHEVWHFPQRCAGLFKTYVDTWIKIKEEASSWPPGCSTPEQREHVQGFFDTEAGILLDATKIAKNPGQRTNKTRVKEFVEPSHDGRS